MYTEDYIDSKEVQQFTPEQKAIWDEMFVCRNEMQEILHRMPVLIRNGYWNNEADITVAAYLLARVSEYNYPFGIHFEDLSSCGIDSTIIDFAKTAHIDDVWDDLLELAKKHDTRSFRLNTVLEVGNDYVENTPAGIIEIAKSILDIKPDDRFADICCGTGSVAFAIKDAVPDAKVSGFDINADAIALAKIGAEMHERDITFEQLDVFNLASNDAMAGYQYDKLFANYPFGLHLNKLEMGKWYKESIESRIPSISKATSSDWLFNLLLVDLLSEDGKAIGIMTNGSTWNMIDTPIRKYFIENGLVECVIALPTRLFYGKGVATSLVVFSHGNKQVRLIDATAQFKAGRRSNVLEDENIDNIICSMECDGENSMLISVETLRENDYVLNISRYVSSTNAILDGVPFSSLIKRITRGAPLNANQLDAIASAAPTDKQYLMLSNIQNGMIDENLPFVSEIDSKLEKYCLTDRCLILSKNGYPYKVAVAEIKEGQKILANGNLYIIEVDEDKVDPYYLAAFFSSELGTAFLKSITVGATIPNIGVGQLERLLIPLPSIERQREIAEKYQAAKDEIAVLKLKLEKARNRLAHAFEEE